MRQPQLEERLLALHRGEHPQHAGGEQVAQRHAGLRPGGPEAALVVAAVLGGHQDGTAPLTADREALHQAADHQQDRRGDADGRVRRQQADRERAGAHHQQRDDQHGLAADLVAEVAEDHAAERPGDEAERVGHERVERALGAADLAEEHLAEDEGGGRPEEEEVVPLDGGADQAGADDLDDRPRLPVGTRGDGLVGVGGHVRSFHAAVQPPSITWEVPVIELVPGPHRKATIGGHLLGLHETLDRGAGQQHVVQHVGLGDAVRGGLVGDLTLDERGADVAGADGVAGDALVGALRGRSPSRVPRGRAWR